MKNLKLITAGILFVLWCLALSSKAQQICGAAQLHHQRMQTDPQYANFYNNLNAQVVAITQNQAASKIQPTVITLPIVVHVTHKGEPIGTGTNISDAEIQTGLARINANYANFNLQGVNMQIQFCLASRDPNGNPTTGITRVNGSILPGYAANGISGSNDPNPCGSPGDSTVKNLSMWPYKDYINIYSVYKICGGSAGYSGVPFDKFSGVVVVYDVFADIYNSALEHELGHFLGLAHTQNDNGADADINCPPNTSPLTQGDFVEDTPPHKTSECVTSTCPLQPGTFLVNSTKNIMSYCFPSPSEWRLTQGQKTRARNMLNIYPANQLLLSDGCNPVTPNDAGIVAIKNPLKTTYTTTCTGSPTIVPIVRIKNYGSSTLTSASVKYRLDNNSLQTFSWSGSIATGASLDVSLPALAIAYGPHTFLTYTTLPNGNADGYVFNDSSITTFEYKSLANFSATAVSSNSCSGSATGSATASTYSNTVIREDFEGATTDWTIVQSYNYVNTTSNWFVGTATANGGSKSIYISNDNGVSNTYTGAVQQYSHIYKDFTFPGNATNITIKFDWKNNGSYFDPLLVFLVPTDVNPSPDQNLSSLNPSGVLGGELFNQNTWSNQIYIGIDSVAGKTKRLVFQWQSYWGNAANQSPAALDNIIVQYTTGVSNPPYTYSWNTVPVQTNATANNIAAGNYTVTVTNAVGCTSTAGVTINANPAITATTSQTVTACGGSTGTATVNASGGTLVGTTTNLTDWEGAHTWTIVNGTQPNKWFIGTATAYDGTKSIYVSDDNGVSNHYVASPPWPNLNLTHFYKNFTFPSGATNIKVEFKYKCYGEWVGDYLKAYLVATSTTPVAGTELSSGAITPELNLTNGNYVTQTITGLNANAGTTKRLVFSWRNDAATQNQPPPSIDNITVSYNTTSTYAYLWSNGQTTQTATGLPIGTYTCTITDILGCTFTKSVNIINNCTGVSITAGGATTFCQYGSVVLTSTLPSGNVWSTGETTQSITVSTSGSYSCINSGNTSNTIVVTVNPIPTTPTISAGGPTTFCTGGSVTLTSSSASGNVWSTGATTQGITVNTSGNYTVAVTTNGCTSSPSAATTVTVQTCGSLTITAGGPTTFCSGGNVVLTSSLPTGNLWSNGATTQSITITISGNYNCTNGGSISNSINVTANPLPFNTSTSYTGTVSLCNGSLLNGPTRGNAVSFDGNNYVYCGNSATLQLSGNLTLEAWINTTTYQPNSYQGSIINKEDYTVSSYGYALRTGNNGQLSFSLGSDPGVWTEIQSTPGAMVAGTWYHVAGTYDGTTMRLFINGNLVASGPKVGTTGNTTTDLLIGTSALDFSRQYHGKIDEVRLWNIARTQTQIQNFMNKVVSASASGLVAYYKMDEGGGNGQMLESVSGNVAGASNVLNTWETPSTVPWNVLSYQWSNGVTTQGFPVTTAGTYTVTVSAVSGCSVSAIPVNIESIKPVTAATITSSGSTAICTGQSVTLSAPAQSNAIQFDGVNDYILMPTPMIPTSGPYSILFWAKENVAQGGFKEIISQGRNFYIGRDNNGFIRLGDGWLNTGVAWPTDLQWHHYGVVRSATNAFLYVDGNLVATKGSAIGSPIVVSGTPNLFIVGDQFCAPCEAFNGQVDDITIWNNLRNQTQIQAAMNGPTATVASGLVAYYKLDEGTGNNVYNAINNSDAGTFTNGPTWAVPSGIPYNITNYLWNYGSTSQSITVSNFDTYKVTVTNNANCTAIASKKVTSNNPKAKVTITAGIKTLCGGSTVTLTALSDTGYTYQWKRIGTDIIGAVNPSYTANTWGSYQVLVTNSDGCTKLSKAIYIYECSRLDQGEERTANNLYVYPNPTSDFITVSFESEDETADIQVINVNGAIVIKKKATSDEGIYQESLDVTQLAPGMYVVNVKTQNGLSTRRFLKQ